MKPKFESLLTLILLLAILLTSSFMSFAGTRKSKAKAKAAAANTATASPDFNSAPLTSKASGDTTISSALVPPMKRRHKVAIVPAPPPGQIPVYVPEKR